MTFLNDIFKPILNTFPLDRISRVKVSEDTVLYGVLVFMWLETLWQTYLSLRQRDVLKAQKQVPIELEKSLSKEKFEKCRSYALDNNTFGIFRSQIEILINSAMIYWKVHFLLWNVSEIGTKWLGLPLDTYEIWQTGVFMLVNTVIDLVLGLPFQMYKTFIIEEKHGFNNQTLGFFVKDEIKKFLVNQIISFPFISGIIYIIKIGGDYFFLYAWLFVTVVLFIMITIYPTLIAPLFDKYTPLPESELKDQVESLAKKFDFPLKKLFVVEGSKRSAHSNAYIYGFFNNKRIVLFDTLIKGYTPNDDKHKKDDGDSEKKRFEAEEANLTPEEKKKRDEKLKEKEDRGCNNEEIVAVLAHELGHWKFGHFWKGLVLLQINTLFAFMVFANLFRYSALYAAFGFKNSQPTVIGLLIILGYILMPYKAIMSFLMNVYSRRREYQADSFAVSEGYAKHLGDALVKLGNDNLSFPVVDKLYSAWHHSHPTNIERLRAMSKQD